MAHWKANFPLKDILKEEDVDGKEAHRIGQAVAARLLERPGVFGTRTQHFAERFEKVKSQDGFNKVLNDLYDVADYIRVWIE